jgi:hypothetical protein
MTLGKVSFAECLLCDTRQRRLFVECQPLALGKDWRPSTLWRPLTALCQEPLCRVFDTRQTCLCRVGSFAECPTLGKEALCREPNFTECPTKGTRQRIQHSAKPRIPVVTTPIDIHAGQTDGMLLAGPYHVLACYARHYQAIPSSVLCRGR